MLSCVIGEYDENILLSPVMWFVHPLSSTQLDPPVEYAYKTSLFARFRSPIWLGTLHVSHNKLRNPNRSVPIYVGFFSNIFCNHLTTAVVLQYKTWCQALLRCMGLWLIRIIVLSASYWFLWLLENLLLLEHLLYGLYLIRNRISSLPIFARRGTTTRGRYTATVSAGWSVPSLPFLSNCTHS